MSSSYLNSLIDDNYGPSGSSKFNLTVNYTGKRDVLKNVEASYSVGQVIDLIKSDILNNDSADIELMGMGDLNAKLSKYGFPKSNSRANYVSVSFKANGGSNDNNDDCKLANNRVRKLDLNKFPNLKKSSKPDSIFGTSNVDCAAMPCGCSMAPQTMYDLIKSVFAKNRSLFQIFCPFHKSTEWDWDYCTEVADMTDDEYFKWSKDRDKRKLNQKNPINHVHARDNDEDTRNLNDNHYNNNNVQHNDPRDDTSDNDQTMADNSWQNENISDWTSSHLITWINHLTNINHTNKQSINEYVYQTNITGQKLYKCTSGTSLSILFDDELNNNYKFWKNLYKEIAKLKKLELQNKKKNKKKGKNKNKNKNKPKNEPVVAKHDSLKGIIGLCNQGNTCFMNTGIQLVLQSPGLNKLFCKFNTSKKQQKESESSSWGNPITKGYNYVFGGNDDDGDDDDDDDDNKQNDINNIMNICNKTMFGYFINLYNKSHSSHYSKSTTPSSIFNRLCEIDNVYRKYQQQDASTVISRVLQDIDDNLNKYELNQNGFKKDVPHQTNITVKRMLSQNDENMIINQKLLIDHNPYNTIVREYFDGVKRIISTCLECNYKKIEYETFRYIQLPLINNTISINIEIFVPNMTAQKSIKQTFNVESYSNIFVLKYLIYKFISSKINLNNNSNYNNIVIGIIQPNQHKSHNEWINILNPNNKKYKLCSSLEGKPLFATIKYKSNTKLITVYNTTMNIDNSNIVVNSYRFIEIQSNLMCNIQQLNQILSTSNKCMIFENNVVTPFDINTKYKINDINVIITVDHAVDVGNNCTYFPSLYKYTNNNCMEYFFMQDSVNKYNINNRGTSIFIKNIPLSVMINDLQKRYNIGKNGNNNNIYVNALNNVLSILKIQYKTMTNIVSSLYTYLSKNNNFNSKNSKSNILNNIEHCLKEYEKEKIFDDNCSQMFCKKCQKNPKIFKEQISIVYSPLNMFFRIERKKFNDNKYKYSYSNNNNNNDKYTHLVHYPYNKALVLSNGSKYNLYGVGCHSSFSTLKWGHYISYIKSLFNNEWYCISDSSVNHIKSYQINQIESNDANILMYTKIINNN